MWWERERGGRWKQKEGIVMDFEGSGFWVLGSGFWVLVGGKKAKHKRGKGPCGQGANQQVPGNGRRGWTKERV